MAGGPDTQLYLFKKLCQSNGVSSRRRPPLWTGFCLEVTGWPLQITSSELGFRFPICKWKNLDQILSSCH